MKNHLPFLFLMECLDSISSVWISLRILYENNCFSFHCFVILGIVMEKIIIWQ